MIELRIDEPDEGELTTLIDRSRLEETIAENMPYVAAGTRFYVNGELVATVDQKDKR